MKNDKKMIKNDGSMMFGTERSLNSLTDAEWSLAECAQEWRVAHLRHALQQEAARVPVDHQRGAPRRQEQEERDGGEPRDSSGEGLVGDRLHGRTQEHANGRDGMRPLSSQPA